jgi:hypothetical protein
MYPATEGKPEPVPLLSLDEGEADRQQVTLRPRTFLSTENLREVAPTDVRDPPRWRS